MKKTIALLLALVLCLSLCACGGGNDTNASEPETQKSTNKTTEANLDDFPFIGTWKNEESTVYLRIQDGGKILAESILTNTTTTTVNGVTTSSETQSVMTNTYSWKAENGQFLFNGTTSYTPCAENGEYSLIGEKTTYYRVGELDFEIPLNSDDGGAEDIREAAEEYTLGSTISAPGIELTLTETGITEDIRITSKSSGIKITSGPSVEAGKKYVYLKGTLKNTGTTATRAAIGGTIFLDDYEFTLKNDTISTSGSPKSSVDPLETVHILLYAQISDEMAGAFADGKIVFAFNDNFADVQVDQAQYLYYVSVTR